jgi:DNA primase
MIPRNKIDEILDAAHITDVVGSYISLKKRGTNLIGLCPFHNEKTPSFNVSPAKGIYKCFGCGKAGNAINFVMEYEHLDFIGALKHLAERYNIELPKEEVSAEVLSEEKRKQQEREQLQVLNNFAMQYFASNLLEGEEGKMIGYTYFEERGFRHNTIVDFKLGYSNDSWDAFYQAAKSAGYGDELLIASGLVKQSEQGKIYDAYRGRVIFPILGLNGKPIAFAGRILKAKDEKSPKYVNSPETVLYHKSNELYGLYQARQAVTAADTVYLVEGYTDVISLYQGGVKNVVASSGTSLTENQIKLIKRFTENVCVLYDGDAAGIKASLRGTDMLLEAGLNVRIVLFPDGEDPDSYCRKVGPEAFDIFLTENKQDFILFKASQLSEDAENDPIKKAELVKDIMLSISKIPDSFKRANFTKECSRILKVDEQLLVSELNRMLRNKLSADAKTDIQLPKSEAAPTALDEQLRGLIEVDSQDYAERELLRLILRFGDKEFNEAFHVASYIINELAVEDIAIENPVVSDIFRFIANSINQDEPYVRLLLNNEDPKLSALVADMLADKYNLSDGWGRYDVDVEKEETIYKRLVDSTLLMLKLKHNEKLISQNHKDMAEAKTDEDFEQILMVQKHLLEQRMRYTAQWGTVVVK